MYSSLLIKIIVSMRKLSLFLIIIFVLLLIESFSSPINSKKTNIFIPTVSFFWNDWENWSEGHVPYIDENVELSSGSIVQLYSPGISTIVGMLNITDGCVFTVYSELFSKNTTTIAGSLLMFANVQINNFYLDNGLIWIMNNASLHSDQIISLKNNDLIIVGPQTISNIYSIVINNSKLILLQKTKLFIKDYLQTFNGTLVTHYNSTINDIGLLRGETLSFFGKIFLDCDMQIKIKNKCLPIISATNLLHIYVPIVDVCGYMIKYLLNNNTITACF